VKEGDKLPSGVYERKDWHKEITRQATIKSWKSEEYRDKQSKTRQTVEFKEKVSKSLLEVGSRPYIKEIRSKIMQENNRNPRFCKKRDCAAGRNGRKTLNRLHKDPAFKAKLIAGLKRLGRNIVSRPQAALFEQISNIERGWKLEVHCGKYLIDIANSKKMIAIEVDGSYWHQDKVQDTLRDTFLIMQGWRIYRIGTSKEEATKLLKVLF
jgi:uncharacterized protein DUF559